MVHAEQGDVDNSEQSQLESAQHIRLALNDMLHHEIEANYANEQLELATTIAEQAIAARGLAEKSLERSKHDARRAVQDAYHYIFRALDNAVDTATILDTWFNYRERLWYKTLDDDEGHMRTLQDKNDRATFDRLEPGATIMNLSVLAPKMIDKVTSRPDLGVENDEFSGLKLTVTFETEGCTENLADKSRRSQFLAIRYHNRPGNISTRLDDLAKHIIVGEDAIADHLAGHEPFILDSSARKRDDQFGAYESIKYLDAIVGTDLEADNTEALERIKDAVVKNCYTELGITEAEGVTGIHDDMSADNLLRAVKRYRPEEYSKILSMIGQGLGDRSSSRAHEEYVDLVAGVEQGKDSYKLTLEDKHEALLLLRRLGEGTSE